MSIFTSVGKLAQKAGKAGFNLPGNTSGKLIKYGKAQDAKNKSKSMTFGTSGGKAYPYGKAPVKKDLSKGAVKGATTTKKAPFIGPMEKPAGYQMSSGLQNLSSQGGFGGSGGSMEQPMQQQQDMGAPYEAMPEQGGVNFDAIINPVLDGLKQSESDAQSLYGQQEGDVTAQKQTSLNRLAQTQQTQRGILEGSATRQQQEGESAADEARRQFAEVQQGLQGQYGGTTGTGAFAAELAGRDTLGRIANIRQGVSSALQDIDDKKVQIEELGRIAAEDIDNEARQTLTDAREELNSTLSSIRGQRGELASRKAEMAMNAMQNFRALKAEVEARNASFKQNLYLRQQDAAAKLADAEGRARSIAESFKMYNSPEGVVRVGNQGSITDIQGNAVNKAPSALYGTNSAPQGVGGSLGDPELEKLLNGEV